jgi:cytosine/adenosine deaminase-related metal-dependent hydrolase
LNLASKGAKSQRLDPSIMRPETVLEMGTIHGAKAAMWYDEIGSLETGKKADIAIFETRKPEWRPVLDSIANQSLRPSASLMMRSRTSSGMRSRRDLACLGNPIGDEF